MYQITNKVNKDLKRIALTLPSVVKTNRFGFPCYEYRKVSGRYLINQGIFSTEGGVSVNPGLHYHYKMPATIHDHIHKIRAAYQASGRDGVAVYTASVKLAFETQMYCKKERNPFKRLMARLAMSFKNRT